MFYRYEIKNNGKEEILYLYMTMNYEFSKELSSTSNSTDLTKRTKNFIKNNSIDFNGNKVYLVVDGIVVKALEIEKDTKIEKLKLTSNKYSNDYLVTIKNEDKIETSITLKDYLLGVLSTNALRDLELTTLKALCVLFRTYAYKQMEENNFIPTVNEYQLYKPISYYKLYWLENYQHNYNKIAKAIEDTDCEFITYNNDYILPFTHITNNGQTESSKNYPYLENRISLWDYSSPYYLEIKDYTYNQLSEMLQIDQNNIKSLQILDTNQGNHINKLKIGDNIFSGKQFKDLLDLKSTDINIIINPTYVRFITKGWGNNLGLSQFGANEIAKVGCSYIDILKYYFPNTDIKKYI